MNFNLTTFRKSQYAIAIDEINELKDKLKELESANQRIRETLCAEHFTVIKDQQLEIEKLTQDLTKNAIKLNRIYRISNNLILEVESLKCCGNCIYYEEHNGYCKGEWDKNKRHLCQLWRDYNG